MKISLKEIKKYIDLENVTSDEIASKLTFAGIEVEGVEQLSSATNLVIGQIETCDMHPNSDHLHVCKVNMGSKYGVAQIVCGAPNARKGLKVIVARVGAKLPLLDIKPGVIRGVESQGMLCSLVELGVDKKYLQQNQIDGIEEVDESIEVGCENVLEIYGLDDTILDIKLLANRSDCNALINLVKELGSLYETPTRNYELKNKTNINMSLSFNIGSNTDKCVKFLARRVNGIEVKDSPKWMKETLNSMGIRSINNVVDIGNYVMLLTGQPLHMYDYDKLVTKELIIKDNYNKSFLALDEKEYLISEGDLCVCSGDEIECLAGVMGSLHSETTLASKNIVIEAAIFDPKSIRLTSNRLGLVSDSSMRFTKGLNKFNQKFAIEMVTDLLIEYANAKEESVIFEYDQGNFEQTIITCDYDYINKRLGTSFTNKQIKETLERVYIDVKELKNKDSFEALIPEHRIDIKDKADLSEEVVRILGLDNVPMILPTMEMSIGSVSESKRKDKIIEDLLVNNGFYQIITYTLNTKEKASLFTSLNNNGTISITNPLTEERSTLRNSLFPSLLDVASYNLNRQNNNFKMFEISSIYTENKTSHNLGAILVGKDLYKGMLNEINYDFYSVKGIVEAILELMGIDKSRYTFERVEQDNDYYHIGRAAYLKIQGKKVGILGEIHPNMKNVFDLPKTSNVIMLELLLNEIYDLKVSKIQAKPINVFPSVSRDLSFMIDKTVTFEMLYKEIKKTDKLIKAVEPFDVYEGTNLPENKKSIALNIQLESDHTLKEEEITSVINKIICTVKDKFKGELR